MQSKAATVEQYLAELPADRRAAIEAVRKVIKKNLPKGYAEGMAYGMIGYSVPHSIYPAGYHCDPSKGLPFAALASQKNHMSLAMMFMYENSEAEKEFRRRWEATGKKLDMGKCCIRFKKLDDIPLDVIGKAIASMPVKDFVAFYEQSRADHAASKATKKPATRKAPAKKAVTKKPAARKAATKKVAKKK